MRYTYLKDRFIPANEALISPEERGFRFGDGVFETIRITDGILYQWERHLARLERGLKAIKIQYDTSELHALCGELVIRNDIPDGIVRLSISRGIGSKGYLPSAKAEPTLIIETIDILGLPRGPVALWLSSHEKISPRALPVDCKLSQGLNSTLARMEAAEHDCFDALQLNAAGEIAETSSANIFWLKGDRLFTPSLECGVLAGTTREAVIRTSPFPVEEGRFTLDALQSAEGVIITNVSGGAVPVGSLLPQGWQWDSMPLVRQIQKQLNDDIEAYSAAFAAVD